MMAMGPLGSGWMGNRYLQGVALGWLGSPGWGLGRASGLAEDAERKWAGKGCRR